MDANRIHLSPVRVLIADDDRDIRWMLSILLRDAGLEPVEAADGAAALRVVRQGLADVILLDLALPDMSGIQMLREVRKLDASLPVILATGSGTPSLAAEAGRMGATGFLTKPFKNDELVLAVRMALGSRRQVLDPCWDKVSRSYPNSPDRSTSLAETLGHSQQIKKVIAQIELVAPTDFTVVITGETGAGKEVVANALHRHSHRASGPLVPVDCGSIPETLIESELFGHEKGAFTGADRTRKGCFEAAAGGTLFLDEIGNLPLAMQAKLLRALQERRVYRVGSSTPVQLDVRVLAATNEDLAALVEAGKFRRDLYYRLNEFSIVIPPLRERGEDLLFLARRFLKATAEELHRDVRDLTDEAAAMLRAYRWEGNVRELRNLIRRAVLLADALIRPDHLRAAGIDPTPLIPTPLQPVCNGDGEPPGSAAVPSFKETVRRSTREAEREMLLEVLRRTGFNMKQAARILQIDYKTMRTKARLYGLVRHRSAKELT